MTQAKTTHTGTTSAFPAPGPACRPPAGKSTAAAGTRIFDERPSPGDVSGSPGAGRASPVMPTLAKASRAQIAAGTGQEADPAASNEGQPRPCETPRAGRTSERPAQDVEDPRKAPLLPLARRKADQSHSRFAVPRSLTRLETAQYLGEFTQRPGCFRTVFEQTQDSGRMTAQIDMRHKNDS